MKKSLLIIAIILAAGFFSPPLAAQEKPAAGERPISVLLYFGVYTNFYRIEEALEPIAGHKIKIANARTDGADFIPAPEEFPMFDVIVMSNVNYDSLKEFGLGVIDSFVKGGGGLLVLGGPFTYGEGGYEDTVFPAMLPIERPEPFDLKWEKDGALLSLAAGHAVLEGVNLSSRPYVYWIHEARPKKKSVVVLKAGQRPLLVLGQHGKGRSIPRHTSGRTSGGADAVLGISRVARYYARHAQVACRRKDCAARKRDGNERGACLRRRL